MRLAVNSVMDGQIARTLLTVLSLAAVTVAAACGDDGDAAQGDPSDSASESDDTGMDSTPEEPDGADAPPVPASSMIVNIDGRCASQQEHGSGIDPDAPTYIQVEDTATCEVFDLGEAADAYQIAYNESCLALSDENYVYVTADLASCAVWHAESAATDEFGLTWKFRAAGDGNFCMDIRPDGPELMLAPCSDADSQVWLLPGA